MNVGKVVLGAATVLGLAGVVSGTVAIAPSPAPATQNSSGGYCVAWSKVPAPGHRTMTAEFRVDNPTDSPITVRRVVAHHDANVAAATVRLGEVMHGDLEKFPLGISVSTVDSPDSGVALRGDDTMSLPPHSRDAFVVTITLASSARVGRVTSFDMAYDGRFGAIWTLPIPLSIGVGLTGGDCADAS